MKIPSLFATMLATILLLTSCSGSKHNSEAPTGVDDPLNNSSVNNGEFSFETHVAPYQEGGLSKEFTPQKLNYQGDELKLNLTVSNDETSTYKVEQGYSIYINGVPQNISIDGGKNYAELVKISVEVGETKTVDFQFKPKINVSDQGEKTLPLVVTSIFNPSYKGYKEYPAFGNAHSGGATFIGSVTFDAQAEISGENLTDKIIQNYTPIGDIKIPYNSVNVDSSLFMIHQDMESALVIENNTLTAELLLYEKTAYTYRLFFYKNHERVKVNGETSFLISTKSGEAISMPFTMENVQEGDFVYAMAIVVDEEINGSAAGYKTSSYYLNTERSDQNTNDKNDTNNTASNDFSLFSPPLSPYSQFLGFLDNTIVIKQLDNLTTYDLTSKKQIGTLDLTKYIDKETMTSIEDLAIMDNQIALIQDVNPIEEDFHYRIFVYDKTLKEVSQYDTPEDFQNCAPLYGDNGVLVARPLQELDYLTLTKENGEKKKLYIFQKDYYFNYYRVVGDKVIYNYRNNEDGIIGAVATDFDGKNPVSFQKKGLTSSFEAVNGRVLFIDDAPITKTGQSTGEVMIYTLSTNKFHTIKTIDKNESHSAWLSNDGNRLVTTVTFGEDGEELTNFLRVYDIDSGKMIWEKSLIAMQGYYNIALYDNTLYAWGSIDGMKTFEIKD